MKKMTNVERIHYFSRAKIQFGVRFFFLFLFIKKKTHNIRLQHIY